MSQICAVLNLRHNEFIFILYTFFQLWKNSVFIAHGGYPRLIVMIHFRFELSFDLSKFLSQFLFFFVNFWEEPRIHITLPLKEELRTSLTCKIIHKSLCHAIFERLCKDVLRFYALSIFSHLLCTLNKNIYFLCKFLGL